MKQHESRFPFFRTMLFLFLGLCLLQADEADSSTSAAEMIEKTITREGIQAAKQLFIKMKQAPEGAYSFVEGEFIGLADRLKKMKKNTEALQLLEMCREEFADSPRFLYNLALLYQENGEQPSFYDYVRKTHLARQKIILQQFLKNNTGKLLTTADSVIRKHLESTGGIEAWRNVRTLKIQLFQHGTGGRGDVLERYYKRPYFFRQGIAGSGSYVTTDGDRVWQITNGVWKEIEGAPYKRTASLDDFFTGYREKGVVYDFVGVEILTYAPVYHLKRTFGDDYQEDLYFSIEAGYLTEKLTPYNMGPSFFTMWDYREIGDISIPHVRMRLVGDFGPPHGAIIKEVQVNIPLDDSLFVQSEK